jgi:hypothetical protein
MEMLGLNDARTDRYLFAHELTKSLLRAWASSPRRTLGTRSGSASSWGKLTSLLWRLHRLGVFDRHEAGGRFLQYRNLLRPGLVSVIDLSDAGMTELSNIAVADVLRGIQEAVEAAYRDFEAGKADQPPRVLVKARLYDVIDFQEDQVLFIPPCGRCAEGIEALRRPVEKHDAQEVVIVT